MLESVTTETNDNGESGHSRSGVFRRIMARDLYEVKKRVDELQEINQDPVSRFLTSWWHILLMVILVMLIIGSMLYFGNRLERNEAAWRQETVALRVDLDLQKIMIEELRQTVRAQSSSIRAMTAASTPATVVPEPATITAEDNNAATASATSSNTRTPLPAFLLPGEVLLIIASTLTEEDAIDRALALEHDGHDTEVILGESGYYGVALGRFEFQRAKYMKSFLVESGVVNTTPYLITDESIDSYVYP